jgi:acyl-CoA reductase-like NAD-dependent aldehyde dehydrogenase
MASVNFDRYSNVIGGQLKSGQQVHQGIDPSTRKPLWDVPVASPSDLDEAILASKNAFASWSKTSWESRQEKLLQAREVLLENKAQMAELLCKEVGKPVGVKSVSNFG